jgi:hypothetical protein
MWIKINGTPVQAMDIEEVLVLDWWNMNHLLNLNAFTLDEYKTKHPNCTTSFFVVVYMKPQSTGVNSWSRMKYFSEPFPTRWEAEQVRDELLTKLNAIEVQIENFSINPRPN